MCALCNETLTHIVKQAEALRNRARQKEKDRNISGHNDQISNRQAKTQKLVVEDERVTDEFLATFEAMKGAIQNEREEGWSGMTKKNNPVIR